MIRLSNLKFGYVSGLALFDKMDLEIEEGSIVGLFGRNGEGKSTLLKLLSGQLLRSSGNMEVIGFDPKERNPNFLEQIFVVPEIVNVPNVSIKEYFSVLSRFYPNYDESLAYKLLDTFGIDSKWKLNQVSQGQQKKAVLALAIALKPKLLLMDEPTNGLDIPSKSQFRQILSEIDMQGRSIIISTHQVRDLEQLIDHIVILEHNKIAVNESLQTLGRAFDFKKVMSNDDENLIYREYSALGDIGVYAVDDMSETDFSIELFFNAIISNPNAMIEQIHRIKTKSNS